MAFYSMRHLTAADAMRIPRMVVIMERGMVFVKLLLKSSILRNEIEYADLHF